MNKKIKAVIFISALTMLIGCYHEPELSPDMPVVCFDNEVLPVIESSCVRAGCHDGGEAFSLGDYASIYEQVTPGKPVASNLHKVISTDYGFLRMPPPPAERLTSEQIDKISLWILQKAEHTTCVENCDSTNVTFSGTVQPIIDNYCRSCHSGTSPQGGFELVDYQSVKTAVEGGRFMGAIRWQDGYVRMPNEQPQLSPCKIALIQKWIDLDMLDN